MNTYDIVIKFVMEITKAANVVMWVGEGLANSQMILDGSEMTRPGLMIINDDDMLPGFIRITDEFGYSRLFKKELLESMDVEMFDIEKPDDLE